jgi:hypothetical protein
MGNGEWIAAPPAAARKDGGGLPRRLLRLAKTRVDCRVGCGGSQRRGWIAASAAPARKDWGGLAGTQTGRRACYDIQFSTFQIRNAGKFPDIDRDNREVEQWR